MLLEAKGITKHFGGLYALNKFDMAVNKDEIVGLIGPNGAGKTTAFNVMTGVYGCDEGSITFDGKNITKLKSSDVCRRGLARTFQLVKIFPNMTVLENVLAGALLRTGNVNKATEKAREHLRFFGLEEKMEAQAATLTLVERKLLEIARSLATEPKLLLLDEAMAGLNPTEIDKTIGLMKSMRDVKGVTLVVVEHVMRAVMNVSDRIVVIHEGRKIADGTPKEVRENDAVITAYLGKDAY